LERRIWFLSHRAWDRQSPVAGATSSPPLVLQLIHDGARPIAEAIIILVLHFLVLHFNEIDLSKLPLSAAIHS
jgi:hypothetical protein